MLKVASVKNTTWQVHEEEVNRNTTDEADEMNDSKLESFIYVIFA